MGSRPSCKEPLLAIVEDPGVGRVEVGVLLHPRGCLGAKEDHLDIPRSPLSGGLLDSIAAPRGLRIRAQRLGPGRILLDPGDGLPPVRLWLLGADASSGYAYLKRRDPARLYLSLPGLRRVSYRSTE